ncbi:double-stranded DNA-dependent ATPase KNAG_0C05350 [Huiozyma naganishii CBS 8797]|uniref:ATP-dependent helicase IRC3 n=1 Tax=Huiozyma naganishii (strain ATCC MYA-139 / BCRC 22969 / CBS 8797 / KCTC 17520 / NBRC 10181 / NCYC 3082 / Yp74L-3) TaxID=1071383 RepID=J7RJD6_HUIN7|nr:hypothetical protein KNAG_0C05350 [Kazachstania naganishii CBS 8797]CCK69633.1 hypothetical protein KNAG_0C05350 [Kazachstania naganishii CBS 8797]
MLLGIRGLCRWMVPSTARVLQRPMSSLPSLRDYQEKAIANCLEAIQQGTLRIGVSLATGGGKTVIFANLIDRYFQELAERGHRDSSPKCLLLVHRRELAFQAIATIKRCVPRLRLQLEMGKYHANYDDADVIIASVQSLVRRLDSCDPKQVDLIVVDEAHHIVADSYAKVLAHFQADTPQTEIPVVGFSATFERADRKAISRALDEIIYHRGIVEMIEDRWLCEGKFTTVAIDADLTQVKTTAAGRGTSNVEMLSRVINVDSINEVIVKTYLHKRDTARVKSTLLFAIDKAHVQALYEKFKSYGVQAEYVTSDLKSDVRDRTIQRFRDRQSEVLINCGILTEGTDIPNIDCILLCRPTRSRPLLVQMIGRGLRLHHKKSHCHIVDFVGAKSVGVVSFPSLVGVPDYRGTLDEATMDDLAKIKEAWDEKERRMREQAQMEESRLSEERAQREAMLRESQEKKIQYMQELVNSVDLTMVSYDSFEKFCDDQIALDSLSGDPASSSTRKMEHNLLTQSNYLWLKFSDDGWAFSLMGYNHLRIYREKDPADKTKVVYKLKLYREIPRHFRSSFDGKFNTTEVMKSERDLFKIVGKAHSVIEELSRQKTATSKFGPPNVTKFAPWRRRPATERQKAYIGRLLHKLYSTSKKPFGTLTSRDIDRYISTLTRGAASNLGFLTSIAPVYPIRNLLKVLEFKSKHNQQP